MAAANVKRFEERRTIVFLKAFSELSGNLLFFLSSSSSFSFPRDSRFSSNMFAIQQTFRKNKGLVKKAVWMCVYILLRVQYNEDGKIWTFIRSLELRCWIIWEKNEWELCVCVCQLNSFKVLQSFQLNVRYINWSHIWVWIVNFTQFSVVFLFLFEGYVLHFHLTCYFVCVYSKLSMCFCHCFYKIWLRSIFKVSI